MNESKESLATASRVLKEKTVNKIITDERITSHGRKILERWAQRETCVLRQLERNWETFLTVLLDQQKWEHPSIAEIIEWQLRNGMAYHEVFEMGAPDLSCRQAMWRAGLSSN